MVHGGIAKGFPEEVTPSSEAGAGVRLETSVRTCLLGGGVGSVPRGTFNPPEFPESRVHEVVYRRDRSKYQISMGRGRRARIFRTGCVRDDFLNFCHSWSPLLIFLGVRHLDFLLKLLSE